MKEVLQYPADWSGRLWWHEPRGRVHRRHHHDELEWNLVLEGTGRYHIGSRVIEVGPRELLWLFPGQDHILLDMSHDFKMWVLVLRPAALAAACTSTGNQVLCEADPPGSWCRRLGGAQARVLDRLYTQVLARCPELPDGDRDTWNAGLVHACLESWRGYAGATAVEALDMHPALRQACRLLAEGEVGLTVLARRCGLSLSRLSHLARQQLGVSLVAYRARQRLERFLRQHRPGDARTMLADALAAGFGSYAQFHRVFSEAMGSGPAEWYRTGG